MKFGWSALHRGGRSCASIDLMLRAVGQPKSRAALLRSIFIFFNIGALSIINTNV